MIPCLEGISDVRFSKTPSDPGFMWHDENCVDLIEAVSAKCDNNDYNSNLHNFSVNIVKENKLKTEIYIQYIRLKI